MFRKAPEARFEKRGKKYYLLIGSSRLTEFHSKKSLNEAKFLEVDDVQKDTPLAVRFEPSKSATLWLYGGKFWWADPGLDENEVKALAEETLKRDERRLEKAMEKVQRGEAAASSPYPAADVANAPEPEVAQGPQLAAGDSAEQRAAEVLLIARLGVKLGAELQKRRFPLPAGGWLEVDGVSDSPPVLCEAWAHVGPAKSAQKHKVMTDAIKLIFASKFMPPSVRRILLFGDAAAASHLQGRSWMGQVLQEVGIETEVIPLPPETLKSVLDAQRRQYR